MHAHQTQWNSHVLDAMDLDRTAVEESIRISRGRHTESNYIGDAVVDIARAVEFIRGKEAAVTQLTHQWSRICHNLWWRLWIDLIFVYDTKFKIKGGKHDSLPL